MPLYHTMGMHSLIAMHLIGGCYVCQPDWDAGGRPRADRARADHARSTSRPRSTTTSSTHPRLGDYDVSSVETLAYAGAAMTSALVERCVEAFSPRLFVNHYGSTEIYTYSIHRDQAAKPGCAGRPALNARLRLGENGEILCHMSSDEAFAGYWNRPDADEKAIRDGWYHTGDVGRLDEDGDLWLDGRLDDMIVSGGENVHPLEVEDVLARHPRVARGRGRRRARRPARPPRRRGRRRRGRGRPRTSSTRTASPPTRSPASSARASTASSSELPKSPSGKILRRMLRRRRDVTLRRLQGRARRRARRRHDHARRPGEDEPRAARGARRSSRTLFAELAEDDGVRFVVITGAGENFTAGGDIAAFLEATPEELSRLAWNVAAAGALPEAGDRAHPAATASASGSSSRSPATSASPPTTRSSASRRSASG